MATQKKRGADLKFKAFSDETRLRILSLLRLGELCVGDIVQVLEVPQPTASRHLAHLRKAELVVRQKKGHWIHYGLAPAASEFHRSLLKCLESCFEEVQTLKVDQVRLRKLQRNGGCCPS